jgi:hypothetical protein
MDYFNWIQKYRQQALSSADRQAYEHEQTENGQLRSEVEAVDLMESLLSAGATGLSESEILGDQPSGKKYTRTVLAASGVLIVLLLAGGWFYQQNQQQSVQPANQEPAKEWGPRFFEPASSYGEDEGPVALIVPSKVEEPQISKELKVEEVAPPSLPTEEPVVDIQIPEVDENAEAIAESTPPRQPGEDIVLGNTEVDKGAALAISAKKTITLKPGFHAKAGSTFRAAVKDK